MAFIEIFLRTNTSLYRGFSFHCQASSSTSFPRNDSFNAKLHALPYKLTRIPISISVLASKPEGIMEDSTQVSDSRNQETATTATSSEVSYWHASQKKQNNPPMETVREKRNREHMEAFQKRRDIVQTLLHVGIWAEGSYYKGL